MDDPRPLLDAQRTAYLEKVGFRVRRFGNHQVMTELDSVTETIFWELQDGGGPANERPSPQPSPRGGEGVSLSSPAPPAVRPSPGCAGSGS
jgi:hypothetical protein